MGKKQHYVPQFYLRNFSDEKGKNVGFFRFDRQKFIRNAAISSVAYRDNLYDDNDEVEKALSVEESKWKKIIDIFLGKNVTDETLNWLEINADETVHQLLSFISITEARTTQQGDGISWFMKTLEKTIGREMTKDTYNQYFGDLQEYIKHPNIIPLQVAQNLLPYYSGLDLLVIVNTTRQRFITSDVPVFNLNPYYLKRKYHRSFGLQAMGLQKFLPISGYCCLCFYDRNVYKRNCDSTIYFLRSERLVHRMNKIIVENAYEQIFFDVNEEEEYIQKICKRRKVDNKSSIIFWGKKNQPQFLNLHSENIWTPMMLPCFLIKKEALKIPLPTHMGGLVRPEVTELNLYDETEEPYNFDA